MKQIIVTLAICLGFAYLALAQQSAPSQFEKFFADGGNVRLQLSSGDYSIRSGMSDRVLVRWWAKDPEHTKDMRKIAVRVDVTQRSATIHTDGPTKNAKVVIEIPAHSDLFLRMRAGDLRIAGIEGNKDIHMTAGDLIIDVMPEDYASIHASVTVGDVRTKSLGALKEASTRSFQWNGAGKYTLHASLFAGDLTLGPAR